MRNLILSSLVVGSLAFLTYGCSAYNNTESVKSTKCGDGKCGSGK